MNEVDLYLRRALSTPGGWLPTDLRRAAVLCPIISHNGQDHILFVMRPDDAQTHPGQMAFPGGMHANQETPLETALRECLEEVGAPNEAAIPLGELQPRESSSQVHVHCVVARVKAFDLRPDPREVARVVYIPLAELLNESRWQDKPAPIASPGQQPATSPHFEFGSDLLWGLTASFVRELIELLPRNLG